MNKNYNIKSDGTKWSQKDIEAVWLKGNIVIGYEQTKRRKDTCKAWISYFEYGKMVENGEGWEIDHIKPVSKGGTDDISNLQPLQWENNRHKGDNWPKWDCKVSANR